MMSCSPMTNQIGISSVFVKLEVGRKGAEVLAWAAKRSGLLPAATKDTPEPAYCPVM